jgi:hypothetical protein
MDIIFKRYHFYIILVLTSKQTEVNLPLTDLSFYALKASAASNISRPVFERQKCL